MFKDKYQLFFLQICLNQKNKYKKLSELKVGIFLLQFDHL